MESNKLLEKLKAHLNQEEAVVAEKAFKKTTQNLIALDQDVNHPDVKHRIELMR